MNCQAASFQSLFGLLWIYICLNSGPFCYWNRYPYLVRDIGNVFALKVGREVVFVFFILTIVSVSFTLLNVRLVQAEILQSHPPILISSDSGFTSENGVTRGSGTVSDPYVIEGWEIASAPGPAIQVLETHVYFVIREVYVHSSLPLSGYVGVVEFERVANGRIENSTISNNSRDVGVLIQYSTNITIAQSKFESNQGSGVGVNFSQNVNVTDNIVRSNHVGIFVGQGGRNVEVVGNDVSSNADNGISVVYASVIVSGNNVHNNGFSGYNGQGIVAGRRCECLIMENTVLNNRIGIAVYSGFSPFHNNFIDNTIQAYAGCPYGECLWTWDRGYPNGGNFWSDYGGVDNCSGPYQSVCPRPDGIGDSPYITDFNPGFVRNSTDRFPLMKPFAPAVSGTVRLEPGSITPQSDSRYLTAVVGLPQGYTAMNLIRSSIRLDGTIAGASGPVISQPNGARVLVVRFNMTQVRLVLSTPGSYLLELRGNLLTSTNFRPFEATATLQFLSV